MTVTLLWFREDLRLADNPALHAAVAGKEPVLAFFVLDERSGGPRARGGAARWWLHFSLESLAAALTAKGGKLHLFHGDASQIVPALAKRCQATAAFWTHRYDETGRAQDTLIEETLKASGCAVSNFNGKLLADPEAIQTKSGTPFRVFTPFQRALQQRGDPPAPLPAPRRITAADVPAGDPRPVTLESLHLLPTKPDWAGGLRSTWTPGEPQAAEHLQTFLDETIDSYAKGRDMPAQEASSRLSPHLASGELSSHQVWHAAHHALVASGASRADIGKFVSELAWRDFSYHLLFHNPDLATVNFNRSFDRFPWERDTEARLRAWQMGRTGYPIVDAGMRQLWQTGWMHNRVRLITASFLVKHLLVDWRIGEAWFWDTLCDADPANNAMNWQWIAGSGPDAAPYFRIFNPILQGEKFDPDGEYVKRYVPELRKMQARFMHRPWDAPVEALKAAEVTIGRDYPAPIVDHAAARAAALAAFAKVKG